MTDVEKVHIIDPSKLSGQNYFMSLIAEGYNCDLLSSIDLKRIQGECLALLEKQVDKLTKGESSSVRTETAQELLGSVFYVIGVVLKTYPNPEQAIAILKEKDLAQVFELGQHKIRLKLQSLKILHRHIKENLFKTNNVFYRSTVVDGIDGFFKLYKPDFFAHELHITADYPTFLYIGDLTGVEFVEKYLRNIACENRFCLYFDPNKVHRLLCGVDRNYQQILMNIYEPILTASLCCVITKRPIRELFCDFEMVKNIFEGKSLQDITQIFLKAANKLSAELSCSHSLSFYIKESAKKIAVSIKKAVELNVLQTVVITPCVPENRPQITFSYEGRMSDRDYTKILERIVRCDSNERRAKIILDRIHSFVDLLEIIKDAELMQNDLLEIFKVFPPEVTAALMSRYRDGDLLFDDSDKNIYAALQQMK